MCRHVAYLGAPVPLGNLVYSGPHSLEHQSYAPREMVHGLINADGFGIGWYDRAVRPEPALYRTGQPLWSDTSFRSLAGLVSSTCSIALVRSATPPSPTDASSTSPYADSRWLFSHNGFVTGFRDGVGTRLRRSVSDRREPAIFGSSDSGVVFAMVLDRLDAGADPGAALVDVLEAIESERGGRTNFLLTDGEQLWATRWDATLYSRHDELGITLASEPFDDTPVWTPVPDGSLLVATPDGVDVSDIGTPTPAHP